MIKYFCDNCKSEIPDDKPMILKEGEHFCMDCILTMFHDRMSAPIQKHDPTGNMQIIINPPEPKPKPKTAPAGSKYDFEKAYAMWEAGKSGRRKPYTQKEIANEIGCSHQRIAQLVKKWEQEYEG